MKLMKRLAELKKQTATKAGDSPTSPPSSALPLKRWAVMGCLLLLVAFGTWAVFEFIIWNTLPPELVGKWEVTEGPKEYNEAIFQFYRNGYMEADLNVSGYHQIIKSTIDVDGKKIIATSKHPRTGEEKVQVHLIRTLTATELVVQDAQGGLIKMKRIE